jgi:hypothetical protein
MGNFLDTIESAVLGKPCAFWLNDFPSELHRVTIPFLIFDGVQGCFDEEDNRLINLASNIGFLGVGIALRDNTVMKTIVEILQIFSPVKLDNTGGSRAIVFYVGTQMILLITGLLSTIFGTDDDDVPKSFEGKLLKCGKDSILKGKCAGIPTSVDGMISLFKTSVGRGAGTIPSGCQVGYTNSAGLCYNNPPNPEVFNNKPILGVWWQKKPDPVWINGKLTKYTNTGVRFELIRNFKRGVGGILVESCPKDKPWLDAGICYGERCGKGRMGNWGQNFGLNCRWTGSFCGCHDEHTEKSGLLCWRPGKVGIFHSSKTTCNGRLRARQGGSTLPKLGCSNRTDGQTEQSGLLCYKPCQSLITGRSNFNLSKLHGAGPECWLNLGFNRKTFTSDLGKIPKNCIGDHCLKQTGLCYKPAPIRKDKDGNIVPLSCGGPLCFPLKTVNESRKQVDIAPRKPTPTTCPAKPKPVVIPAVKGVASGIQIKTVEDVGPEVKKLVEQRRKVPTGGTGPFGPVG